MKYILYARKSTDTEDKQTKSIEDQLAVLREFAQTQGIEIVSELVEKMSAKAPGRPVFNEVINKLQNDEADGILAWHIDRLARNSVDGGLIIYMLDTGIINDLKFPTSVFTNDPNGKFMLSMIFGQSKYYVDALRENVKRGFKQKCKCGEYPCRAPFGYYNHVYTKTVRPDKKIAPFITEAFELYAKGNSTLSDIATFLYGNGIVSTLSKKKIDKLRIRHMLSNPFYIGLFRYSGEVYEGNHEPIVSKEVFNQVQDVLQVKSKKHIHPIKQHAYSNGLIKCETCGMSITVETHTKHQKNGNINQTEYYRCTKKNKHIKCDEKYVSSKILDEQIIDFVGKYELDDETAEFIKNQAGLDKDQNDAILDKSARESHSKILELDNRTKRLLDVYLDELIDTYEYQQRKASLMSEKKVLEEKISANQFGNINWFDPMLRWVETAQNLGETIKTGSILEKRSICQNLFGSTLSLGSAQVKIKRRSELRSELKKPCETGQKGGFLAPAAPWRALVASVENRDLLSKSL